MIYYFSGTGNSLYTAEKLALLTGDKCINIASVYKGTVKNAGGRTDVTGFVFPVYYSGLPEMVKRFASHPEIRNHLPNYVYTVITCGAEAAAADKMLGKALGKEPDYSASVIMPDNYVIIYNPSSKSKAVNKLKQADSVIEEIAKDICRKKRQHNSSYKKDIISKFMYPFYDLLRTTKFFRADNHCTSCGFCERICPEGAIKIINEKPVWIKTKCQHCTACINRCPSGAIQFTKFTENRDRYNIAKLKSND